MSPGEGRPITGKEQDMGIPYRARVNERVFLNLPGFHGGAYVLRLCPGPTLRARRGDA